jgi:hypothetical protein
MFELVLIDISLLVINRLLIVLILKNSEAGIVLALNKKYCYI